MYHDYPRGHRAYFFTPFRIPELSFFYVNEWLLSNILDNPWVTITVVISTPDYPIVKPHEFNVLSITFMLYVIDRTSSSYGKTKGSKNTSKLVKQWYIVVDCVPLKFGVTPLEYRGWGSNGSRVDFLQ